MGQTTGATLPFPHITVGFPTPSFVAAIMELPLNIANRALQLPLSGLKSLFGTPPDGYSDTFPPLGAYKATLPIRFARRFRHP
ncbi:hypothetical protein [Rhizobium sullae]|uniref:Uncharacterized protein n=1 Tax=Rhizobium sullae TaxID=50338 RepID=A0A4R3PRA5_RHISU|nr:hypothetical protein [Rhizobium sullae]TCU06091.1 hypothetical protein EV132_13334 [Rhizobium sullae]UWU19198.1 hypothetical protein N2599_35970 [Rhizobium sullae]